ncbi:MAG: DUF72 domain-containing protein [Dehalococcoidia bacterium]
MTLIKVGCCGFAKGKKKYLEQFKLVEIQQTFYKPTRIATAQKWRQEVQEDFEFSLKAWQEITHLPSSPTYRKAGLTIPLQKQADYGFFKPTKEVFEAWQKTREIADVLRAKIIVFQCPAKFTPIQENIRNMTYFFTNIDRRDFILVWEPRGEWTDDVVLTLCQDLDLVHGVDPLVRRAVYGKLKYFRLHGGPGYRHQYSGDELVKLRELSSGQTYVLFNNITMYEDALRFSHLIESSK